MSLSSARAFLISLSCYGYKLFVSIPKEKKLRKTSKLRGISWSSWRSGRFLLDPQEFSDFAKGREKVRYFAANLHLYLIPSLNDLFAP